MKNNLKDLTAPARSIFILTAYGRMGKRVCKLFTSRQVNVMLDLLKASGVMVEVVEVKKASYVARGYRAAAQRHDPMVKTHEVKVKDMFGVREYLTAYNDMLILRRDRLVVQAYRDTVRNIARV
jgi:hypothetical protein